MLTNTDISPRIGFSVNLDGVGKTVLKGFYGRYYNNLADGFSAANPGGTSYNEYNFNDLNRNGKYDGVAELGSWRTRIGGADAPVDVDAATPHTDEISATVERQLGASRRSAERMSGKHRMGSSPSTSRRLSRRGSDK